MTYQDAHKEFLQLIKYENTSTVEPAEFEKYFNQSQISYVRENYMGGSDAKQMLVDNIQHLRVVTNGKTSWKGSSLAPISSTNGFSVDYPLNWKDTIQQNASTPVEAPKYLRRENISCKVKFAADDPCSPNKESEYMEAYYLHGELRNYIRRSILRGINRIRPYYFFANNKIVFELAPGQDLVSVILEYYRYPVDIAYNSGTGSQSSTATAYPEYGSSADVLHPELTDEDTLIVLRVAARNYLEGVQSQRIKTFK